MKYANTKPRKYQYIGARQIHKFGGRALLADEMGLGKTLTFLYYCWRLQKRRPIVVVCPASLKWQWADEARDHFGMHALILEGRRARRIHPRKDCVILVNYEILAAWVPHLRNLNPQIVGIDECHRIKNRNTQAYSAVADLCNGVKRVIAISGTPLTNRPAELWTILNLLYPKLYRSFWKYATTHCPPKKTRWGWTFPGARKLPELHEQLKGVCMIRRRKSDVAKEIPNKRRVVVPVPIADPHEYVTAETDFLRWLRRKSAARANRAKRNQSLVRMGYLARLAAELKMPAVINWIDSFLQESDEPLLVFGVHKRILRPLFERYERQAVLVDGSVTGAKRHDAVRKFQNDKRCRLFIGNCRAAGVGLNLTRASNVVIVEVPPTPGELSQVEDRAHRLGQGKSVTIYYLAGRKTIEHKLFSIVQTKQEVLDNVLDGKFEGEPTLAIYDQLISTMK